MMNIMTNSPVTEAYRVSTSRGARRGEVSSQWYRRPTDERYLTLDALFEATAARRDSSYEAVVPAGQLKFRGSEDEPLVLRAIMPDDQEVLPTHYSFGQLCQLAKMGRGTEIFRGQPSWLAGLNLQYGLSANVRDESTKLYADSREGMLRAATGPDYGRIFDADLVDMVRRVAGDGSRWKVPGTLDWSTMRHNPFVDVTTETTTLYASDRDVFLFLVDDTHPIEIGTLEDGSPDLVFRGFYAQNSEVGSRSLKFATFWLRAVCMNRSLWGVEDFQELTIIHSKYGRERFSREAEPALLAYADSEPTALLGGIKAARQAVVAQDDDDRKKFLTSKDLGFSLSDALRIMETVEREEGHPIKTVWDVQTGITAVARTKPHQDVRLEYERVAAKVMNHAARQAHLA